MSGDERATVRYITRGAMLVTSGPGELRTIVGMGFAVAAVSRSNVGGGLLHLDASFCPGVAADSLPAAVVAHIDRFSQALARNGTRSGSLVVEIAGGADVLHLLPSHRRGADAEARAKGIATELGRRGIAVARVVAGGQETRLVSANLHERTIQVSAVASGCSSAQPSAPTPTTRRPDADLAADLTTDAAPVVAPLLAPLLAPAMAAALPRRRTVDIGCLELERAPNVLMAVLGSCVGVALFDPATKLGGLAHVMLPRRPEGAPPGPKYAEAAVPVLIDALVAAGAQRSRLQARLVGGACSMFADSAFGRVGAANVELCREGLRAAGIPVLSEDVGGRRGRNIVIDLSSFELRVTLLDARVRDAGRPC